MAYNLLNLCQSTLDKGIVQTFQSESVLFNMIPVLDITGNAYSYNQVHELFEVSKRNLGEEIINIQEMQTTKVVENLDIYSVSSKVDRALLLMSGNTDVRAIETELEAKAMARACNKDIISKLKANAGIRVNTVAMPTADEVAEAMDEMKFVEGSMLMLGNGKTIRALTKDAEKNGYLTGHIDAFGKNMGVFNGVPVQISKELADGEILVVYFSVADGVALASNAGVKSYDLGLKGVHYVTDMELLAVPVIKNTKAVAYINKSAK